MYFLFENEWYYFYLIKLMISTPNTVKMSLEWQNEKYESYLSDFTSDLMYEKIYSPKSIQVIILIICVTFIYIKQITT